TVGQSGTTTESAMPGWLGGKSTTNRVLLPSDRTANATGEGKSISANQLRKRRRSSIEKPGGLCHHHIRRLAGSRKRRQPRSNSRRIPSGTPLQPGWQFDHSRNDLLESDRAFQCALNGCPPGFCRFGLIHGLHLRITTPATKRSMFVGSPS